MKATWRVGIDLAPAHLGSKAPGTARHVSEQVRALFRLDVPWQWVPVVEAAHNPFFSEFSSWHPLIVPGKKMWTRATFQVGPAWQQANCHLGFATAYFVPWTGGPVIANFFDSNIFEYGDTWIESGRRWNYYLNRVLSRYALHRARRLFILSDYCVNKLEEMFPQYRSKYRVTPSGVLPPQPVALDYQSEVTRHLPDVYFLYVGVFSENKNQRRLLEAWRELQSKYPDWPKLVLVGRCDKDYQREKILPALEALPRREEVLLWQDLKQADLECCYQRALAYVQPSIAEGFGLPVIEAMSHGLAVACSRTTSLPEVAGDAAVYFDPYDRSSLVLALEQIGKDQGLRQLLANKARARAELYTWSRHATQIAREIETVLAEIDHKSS